jgi:hypothetical protein
MEPRQASTPERTLLVFNCHEAWVYQLRVLGYDLDIIVGLKGQYKNICDQQMRPVPPNSRLISLSDALQSPSPYYCIITHNISGFLGDDPKELSKYAEVLLEDRNLAVLMGRQAQKTVRESFSLSRFKDAFRRSIETARAKWAARKVDPSACVKSKGDFLAFST